MAPRDDDVVAAAEEAGRELDDLVLGHGRDRLGGTSGRAQLALRHAEYVRSAGRARQVVAAALCDEVSRKYLPT